MARNRVERLLNAYFNRPLKEYRTMVTSLRTSGGLDSEEMDLLKVQVHGVHADAIIRHASCCDEKAEKSAAGKPR